MAARRHIREAWDAAQARDLRELPGVDRIERPGAFGTNAERTRQAGPRAPTLDDGPLYTGEWREEVDSNAIDCEGSLDLSRRTTLCTLRRPWPFVGFAIDTSRLPGGVAVVAGLYVVTRSGRAFLAQNVIGGAASAPALQFTTPAPMAWTAMTGLVVGARVELWIAFAESESFPIKGDLWGYNAPGFGP